MIFFAKSTIKYNASDDDKVSNLLLSLVSWKNHDKGISSLISAVFHILQYLRLLRRAFSSVCSMVIGGNVCHGVDGSSCLAYTVLLRQDDQANRCKKSEVSRFNN